jgi:hypothetical protein
MVSESGELQYSRLGLAGIGDVSEPCKSSSNQSRALRVAALLAAEAVVNIKTVMTVLSEKLQS